MFMFLSSFICNVHIAFFFFFFLFRLMLIFDNYPSLSCPFLDYNIGLDRIKIVREIQQSLEYGCHEHILTPLSLFSYP